MSDMAGLPFDDLPTDRARALSVSELTGAIKHLLEDAFGAIAVEGEISNCRQWSSGHIYFTLKDEYAQIRAVMFRMTARTLKFKPEDGMRVVIRGRLGVYDAKGEYQIICDALEPHGLGARQAAFDQLKRRLQAEGLFDAARKRPLPVLPRRIGVVTSLDGAAIRDILRILTSRHPTARVVVRAARVQGEGAADDLIRALKAIVRVPDVDVVLIGRGGGSAEDLWAFNDEGLARAIVRCPVPVISCVGHEVDFTIADFVADVRAATPSNAAEIVVDRADSFCTRIDRASQRILSAAVAAIRRRHERLDRLEVRLHQWPVGVVMRERDCRQLALRLRHAAVARLTRSRQRFDVLSRRLARQEARRAVADLRVRAVRAAGRLQEAMTRRRLAATFQAGGLAARLDALSPLAVLGRGYAVCWNEARTSIIRSSHAVARGDRVRVTLAEGELSCRVEE
jgi:exodeoxyribonuclease VII large subunit